MAIKHNNTIPSNHFRKDWQRRVCVHFDQAARKKARRTARQVKVAQCAPRPTDHLRPVVRCPTIKYNRKVRLGRGFNFEELKAAGLSPLFARSIGIAVDYRRVTLSEESLKANVERLLEYKQRLILFPRRSGKAKHGDSVVADLHAARKGEGVTASVNQVLPVLNKAHFEEVSLDTISGEDATFRKLRIARSDARLSGVRSKRAQAKAEEALAAKK